MRVVLRSLLVCVLVYVLGGSLLAACAVASEPAGGEASSGTSLLSSPLVVPGLQLFDGGEQEEDAREARRFSPAAVHAREESQSKYSGLGSVDAAKLAREVFPAMIEEPAGGPPKLSSGESIVGFPAVNVARVDQAGGGHSVIESSAPIAAETAPGQRIPVDLGLNDVGGAFEPRTPLARIRVPKRLGDGVVLSGSGTSVTPVDAEGAPLAGSEGSVDGSTVFYANTQTDADTTVKPTTFGFNIDTLLRSDESPRQLYYKVGLPEGASLVQEKGESGPVRVVDAGQTLAIIASPTAHDAEGTDVPVSMSVSGEMLTVTLASFAGVYRLPIVVDPSVEDPIWQNEWYYGTYYRTEWHFVPYGAGFGAPEHPEGGSWTEHIYSGHNTGEWGGLFYTTRGASQITRSYAEGHWNDSGSHIQNYMVLETGKSPYLEDYDPMPEATEEGRGWGGYACAPAQGCPETITGEAAPENNNTAGYKQLAYGPGEGHGGENTVTRAYVDISQEKRPEIEFNTSSSTIYNSVTKEYVTNVLYGSGGWLGPHSGAFEVRAKDTGLGLSVFRVDTSGWGEERPFYALGECVGVQCPEYDDQGYTYKTGMANGEGSFEAFAEDAAGLFADIYPQKVKVDAIPPHGIKIVGFQNGNELPMGETHLKVEATDGEDSTKSSGIKSIKVSVDGHEVSGSAASCPEGPCTADTEFALVARDYTSGQHTMVVTATDNANNVAQEEFSFRVGGASPVSVGPGSVDPSDGQFTLNATDVSLGGTSGVSRTYQSRSLTAGAEGPLGPQWAISVGGGEGLTLLANGNAVLNATGGSNTTFTRNEKGEFESPHGDSNLKLEPKEKSPGKGVSEYLLTDPTTGSKTRFEQTAVAEDTTPEYTEEFGAEAGQLKHPVSDTVDSAGNVWVTSYESDLIEKFSPTGILLATYGSQGSGEGQFIGPWGIAIDPRNSNVYVSDQANNRIDELSSTGVFIKTFGWGVGKGSKAEFEICTKECKAGTAGSGNGQFDVVAGVTIDSSGNVWVADYGNNRVQEFNEKGEYLKKIGSTGKGTEQFEGPLDMAISEGDLYVTDYHNNRIQEFTTGGTHVRSFGEAGSENGKFSGPYGIAVEGRTGNVYVVDSGNYRVQEFSSTGSFITKFGSSGSAPGEFTSPHDVAVSSSGNIYVVDDGTNSIDGWMRPVWLPTEAGGPLAASATTYAYTTVEEEGKSVVQPTEALAPIPAGVSSCTPLVAGCRSLTFEYGKETTAKGENSSEWGNYKGRLEKVWFHGYSPSAKEMIKAEVARYEYDSRGRLRAEWDPRLEHPLKTVYGYDTEGHLTAVTPPGEESWVFTYGTIAGDPNEGRLLKVTRAPASTALWNGELPHDTETPKLSGTAAIGVRMSVSNGSWSDSPVAYSYQWKDCNPLGGECAPIPGATNANYTVASSDAGHTLVAVVSATNGGGSVTAASAASATVAISSVTQSIDASNSLNAVSCVPSTSDCMISDSKGNAFYATNVAYNTDATWKSWTGPGTSPSEAIDCPSNSSCLLAAGSDTSGGGNMYYATSLGGSWTEAFSATYGVDAITCTSTSFCLDGQSENFIHYTTEPFSNKWYTEGMGVWVAMKGVSCTSSSFCAVADATGSVHVATSTSQIESGSWTSTKVDGSTALNGIACTSTSACVAVDTAGDVLNLAIASKGEASVSKHDIDGSNSLTAVTCSGSKCVTVDNQGNVFVSTNSGETWSKQLALADKLTSVSCASTSLCVTVDTAGNVTAFSPTAITEGEVRPVQSGSTLEYGLPASGTGAPYALSKEEVGKWAQKDDPVEGTAIFPSDEPQGWPASGYTRATVHYWDSQGRSVNTAVPTKGISTSEYNEANEVTRTLSADNRAVALKESCVSQSKKECRSAEVSEKLSTETEYNPEGTEIVKVLGPEHKIMLSTGSEVEAREVTHDYYDEDAEQAEEKNKEEYNLLTRTTDSALLSSGEEKDVRTTTISYNGQEDLGWELRKATSTAQEPAGLDLVHTTVYSKTTGDVVETRQPGGSVESVYPPTFSSVLGSTEGSGSGQFSHPLGVAVDSVGDLWVDDSGNSRIKEFSPSGTLIGTYGSEGSGEGQLKDPSGLAIDSTTGNVVVSDTGNNRIDVFSSTGKWVRTFGTTGSGNGQLKEPDGLTVDSHGDVWVADTGNNRVEEFSSSGTYESQFGKHGSGNGEFIEPVGVAISEGELFVADGGNDRVEKFTPSGEFLEKFGSEGTGTGEMKQPEGIGVDPMSGNIYVSDFGNERIDEFSPAGKYLTEFGEYGTNTGGLHGPTGITLNGTGKIYIADEYNAKVDEWLLPEVGGKRMSYSSAFGEEGSGGGDFNSPVEAAIDGSGDIWVTDHNNDRVEKFSPTGKFLSSYGSKGSGNGQFNGPTGIDINKSSGNVYIVDSGNDRIEELSSTGTFVRAFGTAGSGSGELNDPWGDKIDPAGNVWVADTKNNRVQEFSATGTFIAAYGSAGTGNAQFKEPEDIAFSGGNMYVTDSGNNRVQELSMTGSYIKQFGSEGDYDGQFEKPEGIAVDSAGNIYVVDTGNNRIQEFTASGAFLVTFGSYGHSEGQLSDPGGIAINAAGDVYVIDSGNNRSEIWTPVDQAAHDTQTIYYTTEENSSYPTCGKHPEWANLSCQTQPAAQPDRDLPELPVTTTAYNTWDEIEKTEEKFGTGTKMVTRTETQTYDPAGRALTSEETSSPATDTSLPKVTNEYSITTGLLEKQSTPEGTITSKYNKLGQAIEYADASGNVAKYTYEEGSDGRLEEISEGKGKEADSKQTYSYDPTTGFLTKLVDSAAGTFTASYDVEGRMTSETYPNNMTANYTINQIGQATSLAYEKNTHCASKCPEIWFSDTISPSIHGETLKQASTLSTENYAYDNAGRLTETQETPTSKGCITRLYAYDEESNRTSLTTREPGSEGKCATEGGTVERHTYDEANRLTDENVVYETFGDVTKLPANDAGGHELTSAYYVDSQVASQEQNKQLIDYKYDPAGRTTEAISENTETKAKTTTVSHYAGTSELTWTSEGTEKWTRNIPGIDGGLAAIQESSGAIDLQVHDLRGDIVGKAALSETETKLVSTYNSTEFGVPTTSNPPKYSWLGADGVASELTSSGVSTQNGSSYVPEIGRALQTGPIASPGSFPNGAAGIGVINAPYLGSSNSQLIGMAIQENAEREEAKRREAEEIAKINECPASECGSWPEEGEQSYEETEIIEVGAPSGNDAHSADVPVVCEVDSQYPHKSSHVPGTINFVATLACNMPVYNIRMRVALYQNGNLVAESEYKSKGDGAYAQENIAVACASGEYQGWAYFEWDNPPGYSPVNETKKKWSKRAKITC